MSILKTKPSWAPNAVATDRGWQDPITGEVYIAIGNLTKIIAAENQKTSEATNSLKANTEIPRSVDIAVEVVKETPSEYTKENEEIMNSTEAPKVTEERVKRTYNKKPKVQVNEQVEQPANVQILGEVVEYSADMKVIGE